MTPPPHDDDRCARIYAGCKAGAVRYARRLLVRAGHRNRHLAAFDAEELYDTAWETYYTRREYMAGSVDYDQHTARINALILSRFRDEQRRGGARKRRPPGEDVDLAEEVGPERGAGLSDTVAEQVVDRAELRQLLAQVKNPDDAQALIDHEVHGLTFAEIGRRQGITAEAARRRAQRAKEQARHEPPR